MSYDTAAINDAALKELLSMTVKKLTSKQRTLWPGHCSACFARRQLIFPYTSARWAGSVGIPAIIGFIITAVGIPHLRRRRQWASHTPTGLQSKVGKWLRHFLFTCSLYPTIGPLLRDPSCATTVHDRPFAHGLDSAQSIALLIFWRPFAFVLSSRLPGKITVWIGKIINPIFLVFLAVLVIAALLNPGASISLRRPHGGLRDQNQRLLRLLSSRATAPWTPSRASPSGLWSPTSSAAWAWSRTMPSRRMSRLRRADRPAHGAHLYPHDPHGHAVARPV